MIAVLDAYLEVGLLSRDEVLDAQHCLNINRSGGVLALAVREQSNINHGEACEYASWFGSMGVKIVHHRAGYHYQSFGTSLCLSR